MVREKRTIKAPRQKKPVQYDEDDPEGYKKMPVPDKKSSQYAKDKIDEFHDDKIAKLLASGVQMESDQEEIDEEEEEKKEDDLPNEMAWGTKKKMFYDSDYGATKGKNEEDYDLNFFQEFAVEEKDDDKTAGKQERIDFKAKLNELKDELQPLVQMVKDGKIPPGKGADYLKTKQQLYLNYCTNISFYMVLKAKRIPAHNHPVIERLLIFRNLINELSSVDARLAPQFRKLLAGEEKDKSSKPAQGKKAKVSNKKGTDSEEPMPGVEDDSDSDMDEEAALRFYRDAEERSKLKRKVEEPETEELEEKEYMEEDPDAKRGITYQMSKNKGLTPKRKKIDRNPRVKHREKFRRAKIRRKGQVRQVRREETRYSGERSGIRAGVKKSVKLK
ncbi:Something about silencing protein 10 [Dissostichus eleginoides]|uniref:Something about silencing protein 10 n=1 Tax=Dissostichus eleginoides TaxID=100907 RepID=A0AAD9CH22_DISEL|nr:Something about silencing protein 10 [Dissostichus eleginoides]